NDVSLIIFVPLTILLFRSADKEKYILPVISMENIAAIRGSLLTPFGSPQNLFLYGQADVTVWQFLLHMSPMMGMSAVLLVIFVLVLYRKDLKEEAVSTETTALPQATSSTKATCSGQSAALQGSDHHETDLPKESRKGKIYLALFVLVLLVIVTRTSLWYWAVGIVILGIFFTDRTIFKKVDYVLLLTFLCFFIFSSSIAANPGISAFLKEAVAGREYWWAIGLSQIISNVPASIVLYPFTENFAGLIYGADTAGLVSLIGSLASVINYRIYVREYPGNGWQFVKVFTLISWAFFAIVVVPGYLLSFWKFF
ncbi:MAG: hypothetical protein K6A92_01595, partial [Lachnospiraceae bacterium]|nr:hypothetical protein [Lachnospiraceae bacterium]